MNILVAGLSKTGTSGLFFRIKNSMHGNYFALFEPQAGLPAGTKRFEHIITKILVDRLDLMQLYNHFDTKIAIVRDPRDTLVSRILYRTSNHGNWRFDPEKVALMYRLLQKKEADIDSVSLLDILMLHEQLSGKKETVRQIVDQEKKRLDSMTRLVLDNDAYFKVLYEDFVADRLAGLEERLGFSLTGASQVPRDLARVVRTRSSGDWKNWFCERDVAFFTPIFAPFIEKVGYTTDWTLPPHRSIPPEHGSQFFINNIRRCMEALKKQQVTG